jgi:hypothetical protein
MGTAVAAYRQEGEAMIRARSNLRFVFDRLMAATVAAPLVAIALVAPRDAALAQSHIATLPVKHPSAIDGPRPAAGMRPALAKPEREAKSLPKRDRCVEHGACSGLVQSVGSPQPLRPYSFGSGAGPGGTGRTSGSGSVPVDAPPTRPLADPGYDAASIGSGGGPAGGSTSSIENGGSAIKQF